MAFLLRHIPVQGTSSSYASINTSPELGTRRSRRHTAQCACWQRQGSPQALSRPFSASTRAPPSQRPGALLARPSSAQPQASTSAPTSPRSGDADIQWGSFVSCQPRLEAAVQEAVAAIRQSIGEGCEPQLALVFASTGYGPDVERVVELLRQQVPSLQHVFGCLAYGVIGSTPAGPREVEGSPSLSLTLGRLPDVDISVVHTLRSNIPSEDASPEQWAQLVGVPLQDQRPLSFLILADPRFQQIKPLLAGLDFAFPGATKLGGMLSSGQRHKRRAMFAWSADGAASRTKGRGLGLRRQQRQGRQGREGRVQQRLARLQQQQRQVEQQRQELQQRQREEQQRQHQQQLQQLEEQRREQQEQQQRKRRRGIFGLVDRLVDGVSSVVADATAAWEEASKEVEQELQEQERQQRRQQWQQQQQGQQEQQGELEEEEEEESESASSSGVHMYGTAILALQGNVVLEPITSQGYRTVGDKVWTIEHVMQEGTAIIAISDSTDARNSRGSSSATSSIGTAMEDSRDEEMVTPLVALYYLLEQMGHDKDMTEAELEDLSEKLAVAIAPDALSADATIAPDDFQVMDVQYIDDDNGAILVDGEVRTGYRMKLVLRDREGIEMDLRNKLLATKKRDLIQAVVGGGMPQRPAFGALLFADIERGEELYGTSGTESGLVGQYLPVPVSGMFASAEISSVNRKTSVYELTCAIGVLRKAAEEDWLLEDAATRTARVEKQQQRQQQQQQQQQQEQQQQQKQQHEQQQDESQAGQEEELDETKGH